ncbi:LytR/AlgR family response regulator transcription factor [Burkholderia ubonensis]|uniref:DNA-binding response regulator n=1 Tax=Burkholderia ubonensis TaxID=101571 RepID=A0AB74D678_9BURK|nr:LytTR family DNA-binding domain-containing protein [Burkholderia ubonensis]PAJ79925.1 DNA-binding response regulator [Burkholderia ubonensis]PAJ85303.1 DNA-binding response regulator [Burkholderia ubonensis]PAJ92249.1 DNA-binding response regulator [Burkholderia ubonensis]PAK00348.1 DNA-binding response regulator [Burkholderia ubonensis]PAK05605.1 DNA-binding response regulator [Burkholderia ubonensis]
MSALLRVLIVDDARLARQELRTLLSTLPWVECVGEADDVPAAREAIVTLAPDLVLLDVQMPSGSGFDVLEGLETVPAVVFVTAYDTYAVRAFQANALDYLVKPVEAPRLLEALQRARRCEVAEGDSPALRTTLSAQDQVFVREGERCWFVAVSEIRRLVVEGNCTRLWFRDQNALLTRSLSALEARLPPELFFRAHRNTLVNLRCIRRVAPSIGDGYDLTLDDGGEVEVSRRQARELRERLAL